MNQYPIVDVTINDNAVISFELWTDKAPIACESVMKLITNKTYDGRPIERLEPGFIIQPLFFDGLDSAIDIVIEPEYKTNPLNAELVFERGTVGLAGIEDQSSGSQFYFTLAPVERLNGNFTILGRVVDGWDEIERLENVEVEEGIEPNSGWSYHRPVKQEIISKVRLR